MNLIWLRFVICKWLIWLIYYNWRLKFKSTWAFINVYHLSQRMTKSTIRLVRPPKTQISLRIRAAWSESSLIACAFYSIQAVQRGIKENPCHSGLMYRLIRILAGLTGLNVGFVERWLILLQQRQARQSKGTVCLWLVVSAFSIFAM